MQLIFKFYTSNTRLIKINYFGFQLESVIHPFTLTKEIKAKN